VSTAVYAVALNNKSVAVFGPFEESREQTNRWIFYEENRHEKFLKQMERYKRDAEKIEKRPRSMD